MVLPGEAAATAAPIVEKHPPPPPGLTQDDAANAGVPRAAIRAAPVSSWREIDLRFRGYFEGIKMFIDFLQKDFGAGCESK